MEDYEMKYEEALRLYQTANADQRYVLESLFPKLRESEDEEIRKYLIRLMEQRDKNIPMVQKAIAWLKKQDSDKIVEKAKTEKQRVLVTESDGNANIHWDTCSLEDVKLLLESGLRYINKKLGKQGEQKPTEWSEEDSKMLDSIIYDFGLGRMATTSQYNWLLAFANGGMSFKQEWSEKDEKKRRLLIAILNVNHPNANFKVNPVNTTEMEAMSKDELVDWLKSLRDRIILQPKSVWSKEDEKRIENILSVLNAQRCWNGATGKKEQPYQKEIDWLKSLRPQNRWKPTEEQIRKLLAAVVAIAPGPLHDGLESLYEDLKKLTE